MTIMMTIAATAKPQFSNLLAARCIESIEAAAAAAEQPAGLPLQKSNDGHEHHNFAGDGRAGGLLQNLVGSADAQSGEDGANDAANSPQDDRHETVHDVGLAEARTDVADLREEGARQTRQAGAKSEGQHVDAASAHAEAG